MKLLLVNPNTTDTMTMGMRLAADAVVAEGTDIVAVTAADGPESIEGYYDEAFAVPALLEAIRKHPDASAVVVGCFDDTGVDAARCVTEAPVIGLCQAALHAASIVAGSFSIVTTLGRSVPAIELLVRRYGHAEMCRRVRASEIPVLALDDPWSDVRDRLRREIARALDEDGSEAIVLGCAGMVDMARGFANEFSVPVIEGVTAAVKAVEGLARLGLTTSKKSGYAVPRAKTYRGNVDRYGPL